MVEFNIECVPPMMKDKMDTIEKWMKFQGIKDYECVSGGVVINESCKLKGVVNYLPFKLMGVEGNLDISFNPITSFKNMEECWVTGSVIANSINVKTLEGLPRFTGGLSMNSCKQLHDVFHLHPYICGDVSFYGCAISNLDLSRTKRIKGQVILSNNSISSVTVTTSVVVGGHVSLSDNLIQNMDMFKERMISDFHDFSGNPCKASDEWENECKVW